VGALNTAADSVFPVTVAGPAVLPQGGQARVAVLDVLDRDGQVRQTHAVQSWPLRVGRAIDNDLVLADAHVAPHHLQIDAGANGLHVTAGDTLNGVWVGARRLRAGEQTALPDADHAIELTLGRTRLRLRLAEHALSPELPLAAVATGMQRFAPLLAAGGALLVGLLFKNYLETDPDGWVRAAASMLVATIVGAVVWCGMWALLSKTFTRQAHFSWHLRVFLFASVALLGLSVLPALLAFALSWPWVSDFAFIATYVVAGAALYFHLLAVEPARHRLLKAVVTTGVGVGVALTLWFNVQRTDRFGEDLYMNHLFLPALRLAKPVSTDQFLEDLAPLQAVLDKKAKEPLRGGEVFGARGEDEE